MNDDGDPQSHPCCEKCCRDAYMAGLRDSPLWARLTDERIERYAGTYWSEDHGAK